MGPLYAGCEVENNYYQLANSKIVGKRFILSGYLFHFLMSFESLEKASKHA